MAGYDAERPSCTAQDNLVRAVLGPDVALCLENDVETAHRGAFAGGPGIFILAGTGSVVMARAADGRPARAGGWGWLLGDEGGGYWLGRKALRHATRYLDTPNAPDPAFARALLDRLGLPTPDAEASRSAAANALREWQRTRAHPRSAIAELALFVAEQAETGSPTAAALLHQAARHLAEQAQAATDQLGGADPLLWSHGGSVMHSAVLQAELAALLGCPPQPPRLPPLGGAALRAAQLAGWPCAPEWIDTLAHSLRTSSSIQPEPTP
jgi:N-acetylglucosamine kinase-like BadF-type ATPase